MSYCRHTYSAPTALIPPSLSPRVLPSFAGEALKELLTAGDNLFLLHFSCVGVEEEEAPDIDIYHCPNCEKTHGKSTCKYSTILLPLGSDYGGEVSA